MRRFDADDRLQSIDLLPIIIGDERMLDAENYHARVRAPASEKLGAEMIRDLAARSRSNGISIPSKGLRNDRSLMSGRLSKPTGGVHRAG